MLDKTTIYGLRATCAEDRDVGTARVRLPAQFCAANNIAYRKPVFVACNTCKTGDILTMLTL